LHGDPNNQAAQSGRLQDHNMQIMQLCKSEISAPTMTAQASINASPPSKGGGF